MKVRVGQGGKGGHGEDTIINFCDEEGNVLRRAVAKAGTLGAPPRILPKSRTPTAQDIQAGLKVSGIIAADFIRIKDGLVSILDGGWDYINVRTNPFRATLPLLIEVNTGTIDLDTILELRTVISDPNGFEVLDHSQLVTVSNDSTRRERFIVTLEFSGSKIGIWMVRVLAGRTSIGEFPIEVKLLGSDAGTPNPISPETFS